MHVTTPSWFDDINEFVRLYTLSLEDSDSQHDRSMMYSLSFPDEPRTKLRGERRTENSQ